MNTYSIEQYAIALFGADGHGNPRPGKVQWLVLRLRRGDLPGFKAGREWRATQDDVKKAIELLRPKPVSVPTVPAMTGLTRTSARRLSA